MKDTGETLQIAAQASASAKRLEQEPKPERIWGQGDAFASVGDLPVRKKEKPEISSL